MKHYELALKEIGTVEWKDGSNPKVVAYFRDAGHPVVVDDATAWCAAFVGAMLKRAGIKPSGSLLARSYLKWGQEVPIAQAKRGDIGIIPRGDSTWQGHVFFIDRIVGGRVYALGGNQSDSVNVTTYPAASLLGVRRVPAAEKPPVTSKPVDNRKAPVAGTNWLALLVAFIVKLFGGK
jgi:uncharacterized protein (TIGR02594 family)